jgi:Holliday junction resolvase RusA-like endonuclease
MIEFRVYGIPKGQPRPKAFARKFGEKWQARVYDPGTAEEFKSAIATAARDIRPATPIMGPVRLSVRFFFPRTKAHLRSNGQVKPNAPTWHIVKPDSDNCIKAVKDALTQLGFWQDDSQVCDSHQTKEYADTPGAFITIQPINPQAEAKPTKPSASSEQQELLEA